MHANSSSEIDRKTKQVTQGLKYNLMWTLSSTWRLTDAYTRPKAASSYQGAVDKETRPSQHHLLHLSRTVMTATKCFIVLCPGPPETTP